MSKVIYTTYYTGKLNPQKTAKEAIPNDFSMIEGWYNSVVKHNLQGVIFHDHLTEEFVKKYSCSNVSFVKVPYYSIRSLNDERYYVYQHYLKNPDIEWVLTTDLFDVEFNKDPFEYMTNKNVVYVGSETPEKAHFTDEFWPVIKNRALQSYGEVSSWWQTTIKYFLNAGLIGGHRDIMTRLLDLMVDEFDVINPALDTNMFVLSKCIIENKIPFSTGAPFHSRYKFFDESDEYYVRHK